ncbi:hypothetical protein A1O3_00030 [Capronia epimyces CBS 606.96]|uniref:Uncharacterized protein n=1 Tax=Capronia epimyces CBS 606.96 TaxID=1182542 RepID=W9YF28_9EURO|nr:uncharacterized protein A1O3_00030 [Capronia epimyces CBS 606.96]EXJ91482.1 hypothetical protein A1O3_00030 [Capronia epimyces CBS 606.96]
MASYLITGTSRGLGLTLATILAARPEDQVRFIVAAARTKTPALEALINKYPSRIAFVELEVTSQESIDAAVVKVKQVLGPSSNGGIDILINNAGIMPFNPSGIFEATDLMHVLNVNVNGVQLVSAAFLPLLRLGSQKLIFNISSVLGSIELFPRFAVFPVSTYKVSKAALNALTVQWSLDLSKSDFTVVAASPGWLRTDLGTDQADLSVEEGANGILEILKGITKADTGKFFDIHVPGWDKTTSFNHYEGGVLPW